MFGAMRSSRRRNTTPCPCNNTCRCHRRNPRANLYCILIMLGLFVVLFIEFGIVYPRLAAKNKHYIHVGNQICEIKYVETDHTVTGASWGYEKAVCPK